MSDLPAWVGHVSLGVGTSAFFGGAMWLDTLFEGAHHFDVAFAFFRFLNLFTDFVFIAWVWSQTDRYQLIKYCMLGTVILSFIANAIGMWIQMKEYFSFPRFRKWMQQNQAEMFVTAVTIVACIDCYFLVILSSRIFHMKMFAAPQPPHKAKLPYENITTLFQDLPLTCFQIYFIDDFDNWTFVRQLSFVLSVANVFYYLAYMSLQLIMARMQASDTSKFLMCTMITDKTSEVDAIYDIWQQLNDQQPTQDPPDLLMFFYNCTYDTEALSMAMKEHFKGVPIWGGTTTACAFTDQKIIVNKKNKFMSCMAFFDPHGQYDVCHGSFAEESDFSQRLMKKSRAFKDLRLIFLTCGPGNEENAIDTVEEAVQSTKIPIYGGSSADNTLSGNWRQFAIESDGTFTQTQGNGIVVALMDPTVEFSHKIFSGFQPSNCSGKVTKSEGRRIYTIDDEPAATVYKRWTANFIDDQANDNILGPSALYPLGVLLSHNQSTYQTEYKLLHPATVEPDGSITLYAEVAEGEYVDLMSATKLELSLKFPQLARNLGDFGIEHDDITGALCVFCGGCAMNIAENLPMIQNLFADALDAPMCSYFTFGEQGCTATGKNFHGNLMFNMVLFSCNKKNRYKFTLVDRKSLIEEFVDISKLAFSEIERYSPEWIKTVVGFKPDAKTAVADEEHSKDD